MDKSRKEELYYNRSSTRHLFFLVRMCFSMYMYDVEWSGKTWRSLRIKPIYLSENTLTVLGNFFTQLNYNFKKSERRKGNGNKDTIRESFVVKLPSNYISNKDNGYFIL